MGDGSDESRLAVANREIERLLRENEFWYLAFKSAVMAVVQTAGTDAAEELVEAVVEEAEADFPNDTPAARLVEPAARELLERLRQQCAARAGGDGAL